MGMNVPIVRMAHRFRYGHMSYPGAYRPGRPDVPSAYTTHLVSGWMSGGPGDVSYPFDGEPRDAGAAKQA